jgi:hypothetical protein
MVIATIRYGIYRGSGFVKTATARRHHLDAPGDLPSGAARS